MDRPPSPDQQTVSDASRKNVGDRPEPSSPQPPNADEGLEYGCKYCPMVFSSKQALGGHQNAHKVQRAMEKTARELRDNRCFCYYGARPYLVPYNRSHDLVGIGWPAPGPINFFPQAPGQGAHFVENHRLNLRLSIDGEGGPRSRPVYPDLSGFGAPRVRPGGGGNDQQDEDDSGLDLSLKL